MTFETLYNRLQGFDLRAVIMSVIMDMEDDILSANRDQMYEGRNVSGGKIGTYKNKYYAKKKNRMNPLPSYGVPDLFLSGTMYRRMYIDEKTSQIDSLVDYIDHLYHLYGDTFFGLSKERAEEIKPDFQSRLKQKLNAVLFK